MKKNEKIDLVSSLSNEIKTKNFIIFNFKGITVNNFLKLRKVIKKDGFQIKVIKNTLIKKILEKNGVAGFDDFLVQENALIYGADDYITVLKDIKKFASEINLTNIKAAYIENKVFNEKDLVSISKLPSKQVLIANLLQALNTPVSSFMFVLNYNLISLVSVLSKIKETKVAIKN